MEAGVEEDVQERPGDKHSGKIYRRCESAGVAFVEWPVIEVGAKVSSPNVPAQWEDLSLSYPTSKVSTAIPLTLCSSIYEDNILSKSK